MAYSVDPLTFGGVSLQPTTPGAIQAGNVGFYGTLLSGSITDTGAFTVSLLPTPVNATFTDDGGGHSGTLHDSTTYYYRVTALDATGETLASTETSITTSAGTSINDHKVTVKWAIVNNATGYKVYGRSTGAELFMATIASNATLSWVDDGSVTPSGALPSRNSTGDTTLGGNLTTTGTITSSALAAAGVVTNTSGGLLGTLAGTATTLLHGNASGAPTYTGVALADFVANLGTTTTVLHGNAAGQPTYGPINLTTDVAWILPVVNGGTGVAATNGITTATLATPVNSGFSTSPTGGTLLHSTTYFYRVTAVNANGETLASTETSQATGGGADTATVTVNWGAVVGATSYNVYGRTTGAETKITASVGTTGTTYTDTGSALSGALPTRNSTADEIHAGNVSISGTTTFAGCLASGSVANDFSGSTGTFKTSTGVNTFAAATVSIGIAGTSNGQGIRHGASRIIFENKPTAPVDIAGGITATVTQILEAGIFLCSASATLTLPAMQGASGLVQALPGAAVGDIIGFVQIVAAGQTATLAVGANGSTIASIATTAAAATGRQWNGRITNVGAGTEAVTWY